MTSYMFKYFKGVASVLAFVKADFYSLNLRHSPPHGTYSVKANYPERSNLPPQVSTSQRSLM